MDEIEFTAPGKVEKERDFTGRVIVPEVSKWLQSLRLPWLSLKGDGATQPEPLHFEGMSFIPDLTIKAFEKRYLALEVKFLTDVDAGGSLSKALGQSQIYKSLGFIFSHAIAIDIRKKPNILRLAHKRLVSEEQTLFLFS